MRGSPSREYWGAANNRGDPNTNTILPGLVDRSLGVTEFRSQQTSEPTDPTGPRISSTRSTAIATSGLMAPLTTA